MPESISYKGKIYILEIISFYDVIALISIVNSFHFIAFIMVVWQANKKDKEEHRKGKKMPKAS